MIFYLLTGRTGSGKRYFSDLLENNGLVKNTIDSVKKIEEHDLDGNFAVVKPQDIVTLLKKTPRIDYHLIYLDADPKKRPKQAIQRLKYSIYKGQDKSDDDLLKEYHELDNNESKEFDKLEKQINKEHPYDDLPENLQVIHILNNDYSVESNLVDWARRISYDYSLRTRLSKMVNRSSEIGLTKKRSNGLIETQMTMQDDNKVQTQDLTADMFADALLNNQKAFIEFMVEMLTHDSKLDDIYNSNK